MVLITQAVLSGGDVGTQLPVIKSREPISQLDAACRREAGLGSPILMPLAFERRLAHDTLASLSGCSGSGIGFCRCGRQRYAQIFADNTYRA